MKVLLVHNRYQERGGEDVVFETERDLLVAQGVELATHVADNQEVVTARQRLRTFASVGHNRAEADRIGRTVREGDYDLVHFHNFFPIVSPGAHLAAAASGAAVIQTLHNYRLLCAGALLMRSGTVCEDCLGGSRHHALVHRCYRGSLPGSLAVLLAQNASIRNPAWIDAVSRFIVLTEFGKGKFVAGGIPAGKIVVKPNCVPDPGEIADRDQREGALFVGRISPEKGVPLLVEAWRDLADVPLTIVGGGPELDRIRADAPDHIRFTGPVSREEIYRLMQRARFLVLSSTWYEGLPTNILEALACGLPAIVPNLGGMPEPIEHGHNGFLFDAGSAQSLAATVRIAFSPKTDWQALSSHARTRYEQRYAPEPNIAQLLTIYEDAIAAKRRDAV